MVYFGETFLFSDKNKRQTNQDVCGYMTKELARPGFQQKAAVYFVADGVSGSEGDISAARLRKGWQKPVDALLNNCLGLLEREAQKKQQGLGCMDDTELTWEIGEQLRDTVLMFDKIVREDGCISAYGATISLALVLGCHVYTANLGDSPMLLVKLDDCTRPEAVEEIYQCQNEAAGLPEEKALVSELKNYLSGHVLGDDPSRNEIYIKKTGLQQNNLLLMGTDGALAVLPQRTLRKLIEENVPYDGIQAFHEALFSAVKQVDTADDNYTLLGVRIETD